VIQHYLEDVHAARAIVEKIGEYHAAYLDLSGAHFRAGDLDEAERCAQKALSLAHPTPGLAYNTLAVIAYRRGDLRQMQDLFMTAAKTDPQHHVLIQNVEKVRAWFRQQGPENKLPLDLSVRHDFQLLERTLQPTLPGPLTEGVADFSVSPQPVRRTPPGSPTGSAPDVAPAPRTMPASTEVTPERYGKQGFSSRRLRVLS
jgi:tetratricopeptide (TPR) repeat protein